MLKIILPISFVLVLFALSLKPNNPQVIGVTSSNYFQTIPPEDPLITNHKITPTFGSWLNRLEILEGTTTIANTSTKLSLKKNQYYSLSDQDLITINSSSLAQLNYYEGTSIRSLGTSKFIYTIPSLNTSLKLSSGIFYLQFKPIKDTVETFTLLTPHTIATSSGQPLLVEVTSNKTNIYYPETQKSAQIASKLLPFLSFNQNADKQKSVSLKYGELVRANCPNCPKFTDKITFNPVATFSASLFKSANSTILNLPTISSLSGEGFLRSQVNTDFGTFPLTCIGGAKSSTKIVTDTANDDDCTNNCSTMPLADFVNRNHGFAGMNGSYFCPASYPSCESKKDSFDTLAFNSRLGRYINSNNNVYSVLPFWVFFHDGSSRVLSQTLSWGRDTNISGGMAGNPLLVSGGKSVLNTANLDQKQSTASFGVNAIVETANTYYFCHLQKATIAQSAKVYEILGASSAMNVDGGGSAALYAGGYKVGPGRNIPNALIMVRR